MDETSRRKNDKPRVGFIYKQCSSPKLVREVPEILHFQSLNELDIHISLKYGQPLNVLKFNHVSRKIKSLHKFT